MKCVVLDTNVLVSALLVPGSHPSKILEEFRNHHLQLILSGVILEEYGRVLHRKKFGLPKDEVEEILALIMNQSLMVIPSRHFHLISEDPADNEFLDVALEGGADAIISGDHHLLFLKTFRGIPILSPAEFLAKNRSPA